MGVSTSGPAPRVKRFGSNQIDAESLHSLQDRVEKQCSLSSSLRAGPIQNWLIMQPGGQRSDELKKADYRRGSGKERTKVEDSSR